MENKLKMDKERVEKAKIGQIVPIVKTIKAVDDPVEYFAKLSDYGRKKNIVLLESADIVAKYGENSLGSADPCLRVRGCKEDFEVKALNELGERFIKSLKGEFDFCNSVSYGRKAIKGKLKPARKAVNEEERLKLKTHIDIIRRVAFKFKPTAKPFIPYCGLFGAISYDFIDQFEDLPKDKEDVLKDPDYELYFLDNLFLVEHKKGLMHIIANALIMDDNREKTYNECVEKIGMYEKALLKNTPKPRKFEKKAKRMSTDTKRAEFINMVGDMKKHITAGDIFQIVPSRTIMVDYNNEPLDIYRALRKLNPSPYMFFINDEKGTLLGASPEMSVRVQGDKEKIIEIRPIAGTTPRGLISARAEKIDKDLDSRYETELKVDYKELAEHTMLIDLARNDVARVSKAGTRFVNEPYIVEKYSHVQHLVSNVQGILKDNLDALHAYLASMNMGTLTGCPKVEAMKLIRKAEKTKRGYYGGAVGYITPSDDFDSCIVIRSMRLKKDKAYIRVGAGIVYDSIPNDEFDETEKKAKACLEAIELAGVLK